MKLNKMIDHTNLKPDATQKDIEKLILEAIKYDFFAICINPSFLLFAKPKLKHTNIKICCVASFPFGTTSLEAKLAEIKWLIENGCDEIDFVINVAHVKDNQFDKIEREFSRIRETTTGHTIKVIIETCFLSKDEIVKVCKIADKCSIDFVKTSTGFAKGGATAEDVKLMKESISSKTSVKASGGIRTYDDAIKMVNAGASRIGTSQGVVIAEHSETNK
ncbi:deoxyribose-phosphate aldolase [Spiroplasma endosymbiont of Aspidapion aeneum]|uniref:deoxyribose-phosphate aldolase n=1 Tax=Spiroplasma endosymbiont of Aspidapion aeneum TaxID=3066276 RepID=UPI00313D2C95